MPTALIGDVIASRDIPQRDQFQILLKGTLEALNEQLGPRLTGQLVVVRGDEIEALLSHPQDALRIMTRLEEALAPQKLTWGLGHGELATHHLAREQTSEMDGACFHQARSAFELARSNELWAAARGFDTRTDTETTTLFQLLQAIRWRWTERQTEIVSLARERLQKEVAQLLDVNPSVVSKSLKAAAFPAVLAGEAALTRWFAPFGESAEAETDSPGKVIPPEEAP